MCECLKRSALIFTALKHEKEKKRHETLLTSVLTCSFEVAVNRVEDTDHVVIPVHLREKYKQSGYNHTSTPLFGLPFLVAVPRSLSEDKLYNMLLLRLWLVHFCRGLVCSSYHPNQPSLFKGPSVFLVTAGLCDLL